MNRFPHKSHKYSLAIGISTSLFGCFAIAKPFGLQASTLNRPHPPSNHQPHYYYLQAQLNLSQGTLLRGSSAAIYVIDRGGRRLIPDEATFNHLEYSWDEVIQIPDHHLNNIPELPPIKSVLNQPLAEGTIVKASDSDRLYTILAGQRRELTDPTTLGTLGLQQEDVVSIPPQQLAAIPELNPSEDIQDISEIGEVNYADGSLLKGDSAAVYLISGRQRRLVPNAFTFEALGYKWEDVIQISDRELAQIPLSLPLASKVEPRFKDGTLIKGSAPAVYVIHSGRKRLIPNQKTFEALGYQWQEILVIEDAELDAIADLPPLPSF
ncbi:hypothetical protein Pse7367_2001 [Thalassoporum mexicanum PCC 7367]|nr:hypothetical protein Pse7367_2001 [Pseudanabaena sp. PCC 7367]